MHFSEYAGVGRQSGEIELAMNPVAPHLPMIASWHSGAAD
jgi:hypothetical protein